MKKRVCWASTLIKWRLAAATGMHAGATGGVAAEQCGGIQMLVCSPYFPCQLAM